MSEPAEGWYPDPNGAPQLRWWDGQAWSDYVEPYEAPNASAHAAQELGPGEAPASSGESEQFEPIPTPAPASRGEATHASPLAHDEHLPTRDEPTRSGTLKWTLGAIASWSLVVVFIVVLVIAWSHLGASSRVHDDAKERARSAQEELDAAQSTLDDINRQIEEAQK